MDLKESCLQEPGNLEFWEEVQKLGRSISLISDPEAKKLGGSSEFSESFLKRYVVVTLLVNVADSCALHSSYNNDIMKRSCDTAVAVLLVRAVFEYCTFT